MFAGYHAGVPADSILPRAERSPVARANLKGVTEMTVEFHPQPSNVRPDHREPHAHASTQPFRYPLERPFVEPDWTRLPGYREVTPDQWESAQWQRAHSVKNLKEFKEALGEHLDDELLADIERDQQERATMSMLIPPQMINTMREDDLRSDPVRRYMAPSYSEREPEWPSHPMASRDSLHEADMWAVEGLTHRYPTKVLAELIPTCPQYCGHCTRMDLVGNDTLQVLKYKFEMKQNDRWDAMLDYLRTTPQVRDVVVSGGDMANVPAKRLQAWLFELMDIENIRDIRIATKGLMGIPQHFLQDEVLRAYDAIASRARERDVDVALHTHVNASQQVTPLVGKAVRALLDMGYRDVRNQGVLLRGVDFAGVVFGPRSRTPWFRTSRYPMASSARTAFPTSGVTCCAALTCVWRATSTSRSRARDAIAS